jgi:hypothetical protein
MAAVSRKTTVIVLALCAALAAAYFALDPGPRQSADADCRTLPGGFAAELTDAQCASLLRLLAPALATATAGSILRWSDPNSGAAVTVKLGAAEGAGSCRGLEMTLVRAAVTKRVEAKACLKDGIWTLVATE